MSAPYTPTVYEPARSPGTTCQQGALALLAACRHVEPALAEISHGCYNNRPISGTSTLSLHAEGRAVDLMCRTGEQVDAVDRLVGAITRPDGAWRVIGVQQVIWWEAIWRFDRGWRPYTGAAGPHKDHAHIELIRSAAAHLTTDEAVRALRGAVEPVEPPVAPEPPVTPEPPVADEEDTVKALTLYRDRRYWNVWLVGGAQALHVGPALREHYVALGVPEVVDQHDPTLESVLWQSGTSRASLVPA